MQGFQWDVHNHASAQARTQCIPRAWFIAPTKLSISLLASEMRKAWESDHDSEFDAFDEELDSNWCDLIVHNSIIF